jgi:hypothetical protein
MATQEERIGAIEKEIATMKHDIIYKLDDTNSAITIVKGITGTIAQDVKIIKSQLKTIDIRIDGVDTRFDQVDTRFDKIEATMATKDDIAALENRMQGSIDALEKRVLDAFQQLIVVIDTRLPSQEK